MLHEEGRAGSLSGVRVGLGPGVGPEGWHMWLLYPLGAVCRGHAQSPAFAPSFSELASDFFLSFSIFLSIICPSCPGTQLFLVRYSFFAFCCWRRCLSRYQHCSRGSQPFSGPNSIIMEQMLSDQASEMTTRRRFRGGQRASLVL